MRVSPPDFAYAGEVALGVVLADPTGELADLKRSTQDYPATLSQVLRDRLGEAEFLVVGGRKAVSRRDTSYVAGCLFRVVGLCAHAIHGSSGRWPNGGQPRRGGRCRRAVGRRRQSALPTVTGYPGRPSKLTAFFSSR